MFNWFKKEAPLKALAGMGGGVGRGGVGSVDVEILKMVENLMKVVEVEIHLMEGGQPFLVPLLQELRLLHLRHCFPGGQAFYDGGPGTGNGGRQGGGFTAVWVGGRLLHQLLEIQIIF